MSWRVQYHPEAGGPGGVVEVVFGGMLSGAELLAGAAETLRVARVQDSNRLLADCRTLEGGHSVFDLYQVAESVAAAGLRPLVHEAVLIPFNADMAASVAFWQTAATNRGLVVQVFKDRQAALDWLAGPPAQGEGRARSSPAAAHDDDHNTAA